MFTVNIQKGGAMLDDTRHLIELWDDSLDGPANLRRVAGGNLLGKKTRKRSDDVLMRILGPRYVAAGKDIVPALRSLKDDPRAFREACYYETSRDEQLLAEFAQGPLFDWYAAGRIGIGVEDAKTWLESLTGLGQLPDWTDTVRTKVARGLLASLRDFGILRGAVRKEFNAPGMSPRGFAYVAYREHEQGASARALIGSAVWRRWLLDRTWVRDLFTQIDRLGVVHFAHAGSAIRLDWRVANLQGVTRAAA